MADNSLSANTYGAVAVNEEVVKITPDEDIIVTLNMYQSFYATAWQHCIEMENLFSELRQFIKDHPEFSEEDVEKFKKLEESIGAAAGVAILFSALTLEAFINAYALGSVSSVRHFKEYFDFNKTKQKWVVFPRLFGRREFPSDGEAFKGLKQLFGWRNEIVHYKTKKGKLSEITKENTVVTLENARQAVKIVEIAVRELKEIDPTVDLDWVIEVQKGKTVGIPGAVSFILEGVS